MQLDAKLGKWHPAGKLKQIMSIANIVAILGKFSQGYELKLVKSVRYYPQNLDKGGDNF